MHVYNKEQSPLHVPFVSSVLCPLPSSLCSNGGGEREREFHSSHSFSPSLSCPSVWYPYTLPIPYTLLSYPLSPMSEYSVVSYWNDRYARDPEPFEWYQTMEALKPLIDKYVPPTHSSSSSSASSASSHHNPLKILVLGCGTSSLSSDLLSSYPSSLIYSIDFSSVAIDIQKKRYNAPSHMSSLHWICGDIKKMDFPSDSFHLIIDKGTLDSVMCGEDNELHAHRALSETCRVLAPGGQYIAISHADPQQREYLFKATEQGNNHTNSPSSHWSHVQYVTLPKPKIDDTERDEVHYIYVATKQRT